MRSTVDGHSYPLAGPFMAIATQNPVEMEGTYALPEAQRDRFTARISLGYPTLPPNSRWSTSTPPPTLRHPGAGVHRRGGA